MVNFKIKIANKVFDINCFYESTKNYCKDFLTDEKSDFDVTLSEDDLKSEIQNATNNHLYVNEEISALYRKIADILVEENIVVFHSSSIKVNDFAFIFTARSGVGKSTHTNYLSELLKDQLTYINDDKPLLEVSDEKIIVYSNPWNGKERRSTNTSAPLKAIIFLSRGETNSYKKIEDKSEVYFKLLSQIYLPYEKSKRQKAMQIADQIIKNVNFYEIFVTKDISAAEMTYERIIKNETK